MKNKISTKRQLWTQFLLLHSKDPVHTRIKQFKKQVKKGEKLLAEEISPPRVICCAIIPDDVASYKIKDLRFMIFAWVESVFVVIMGMSWFAVESVVLTLKPQTSHTCIVHTDSDRHKNKYIHKLNFAGTLPQAYPELNTQKGEKLPQTPFADRKADVWTTKL